MTATADAPPQEGLPASDVDAEQAVLGAMLLSPAAVADVTAVLDPGDYYRPAHAAIHEAIATLDAAGRRPDPVTVSQELARRGELERVGGAPYLHTLIAGVPTTSNAGHYAQQVAEAARLRRLREAGMRLVQYSQPGADPAELADMARAAIDQAVTGATRAGGAAPIGHLLEQAVEDLAQPMDAFAGVPTGWNDLDMALNPMLPGQFIVVGARPSVGKSVFGVEIARHAAVRLGLPALLHSLEMGAPEVTQRLIAAQAKVPLGHMTTRSLTDDDWDRIARAQGALADAPLYIDDSPRLDLTGLRASIRRHRPRLVVVDYLQLMQTPQAPSRREAVDELSRGYKLLAKTENVPIVVLAQLNRASEQRHDKGPRMSDLRESGGIEADADTVLLLHREDLYNRDSPRAGEIDIHIAKQRNGPTSVVPLGAQLHYARLCDLTRRTW